MEMVRHNVFGLGEVVRREVIGGFPYLWVWYENGAESKLGIPYSFASGAVEALGSLKDEVDQAIADKKAKLSALAPSKIPAAPANKVPTRYIPSSPIEADFENYLISRGYKREGDKGNHSTVYYYIDGVETVLTEEGISWDTLKSTVSDLVPKYDAGGVKELVGAKQHRTVINGLKRFAEFVGKP